MKVDFGTVDSHGGGGGVRRPGRPGAAAAGPRGRPGPRPPPAAAHSVSVEPGEAAHGGRSDRRRSSGGEAAPVSLSVFDGLDTSLLDLY